MPMGTLRDISTMLAVSPQELIITSVRTKKLCIQDILTQKGVDLNSIFTPYEPPKLVDLIKQGMTAVTLEELNKDIERKEEEMKKEDILESIKQALELKAIESAGSLPINPVTAVMPPEVNVPVVTYEPWTGGQMQSPSTHQWPFPFPWNLGQTAYPGAPQSIQPAGNADILLSIQRLNAGLREMIINLYKQLMPEVKEIGNDVKINREVTLKGNKYVVDTIHLVSKAMTKSLADYFRNMVLNLIKNGCAYFPVGIAGQLNTRVINNTLLPQAITFSDVVVKSMGYVLSRPQPFTVFAGPMENDLVKIPILVENVDAVDYILDHRGKGSIPITLTATISMGAVKQTITFSEGNVVVR